MCFVSILGESYKELENCLLKCCTCTSCLTVFQSALSQIMHVLNCCVMAPPIHLGAWSMALMPFELIWERYSYLESCFFTSTKTM